MPARRLGRVCAGVTVSLLLGACGSGAGEAPPPPVPGGVTVRAGSSTTVHVMWDRVRAGGGVTGYAVYRDGTRVKEVPVGQHMTDVTGLKPSAGYSFTVRSRDGAGTYSAPSRAGTVTTPAAGAADDRAPTRPTGLRARAAGPRSVTLTWKRSRDDIAVASYDIHQRGTKIHSVGGGGTTARVTALLPDTRYSFTVEARDAADNVSGASGTVTVTTAPGPVGSGAPAPEELKVTTGKAAGTHRLELSWKAPRAGGAVSEYQVYVNGEFNTSLVLGPSVAKDHAAISVPVLGKAGTSYTVKVRGRLPDGNWGPFSAPAAVRTGSDATPAATS